MCHGGYGSSCDLPAASLDDLSEQPAIETQNPELKTPPCGPPLTLPQAELSLCLNRVVGAPLEETI